MKEWITKKNRLLLRCVNCRLVQVPEGLATTDRGFSVYEDEDNIFITDGNENYYFDETYMLGFQEKLKWVQKYVPEKARLLDAGANLGHFLKTAQGYFEVSGFELSPMMVNWSRENLGVPNQVASIYDLPQNLKGPYDAVTCWDVIEHLPDPLTALKSLWEVLKPGGHLFLSTPDLSSLVARIMGQYWHYLDPIQHITLFGKENLKKILASTGFKVVDTCSFGHHYRMRYIFDRLLYFHQSGPLRRGILLGKKVLGFSLNWTIYLRLFDVMGIACVKSPQEETPIC
jgi:2-polyprenyl-3-methyl-5-hydroxy-6-metoxy-1,4-benzoquinol methylase